MKRQELGHKEVGERSDTHTCWRGRPGNALGEQESGRITIRSEVFLKTVLKLKRFKSDVCVCLSMSTDT